MNLTEKPLSSEYPYRGKIVNMRVDQALLPNGRQAVREVVEHPGGVCVAALTDREELLFVRQFRYPYQEAILELPAGKRSPGAGMRHPGAEGGDRGCGGPGGAAGKAVSLPRLHG